MRKVQRARSRNDTNEKSLKDNEIVLIKTVQHDLYQQEIDCIRNGRNLSQNSAQKVWHVSPVVAKCSVGRSSNFRFFFSVTCPDASLSFKAPIALSVVRRVSSDAADGLPKK